MALQQITSGKPPALWSTMDDAFKIINDNFLELDLRTGSTDADFSSISSNIAPSETGTYTLGTLTKRWKRLYLNSDGLHVGNSIISEVGGALNLPEGSKVGGVLIKNPNDTIFKTIAVSGQSSIVADGFNDTLTVQEGFGITLETNSSTDTLTITNSGVTRLWVGDLGGISLTGNSGQVSITNTGVRELTTPTGSGISLTNTTGEVEIENTGVVTLEVGDAGGLIIENTGTAYTIVNSSPNITQSVWKNIAVSGQGTLEAVTANSTLNVVGGTGITVTTNTLTDSITITATGSVSASGLENGSYSVSLTVDGNLLYPGDITQSSQDSTNCPASVDTVIYTATDQYQHAIKLFVMIEGLVDGDSLTNWQTQACDIIAVRGYVDNIVHVTAYGVTYSSASAFATFDGRWNATTNRMEITCRPTSVTNAVTASVHAIEMTSNN